ncbi:MAG: hypothetical protein ACEB74_15035 [Desulfovibrio aminophilus]|jgi:Fe-S cluster assembly iron-binding protein IscA|nr:hypothetical protein [Desulfovibrio aminophilus]
MRITPEAKEKMIEFLDGCGDSFIRVGRQACGGGCSVKLNLGVTLDDAFDEKEDMKLDIDGLTIVVDRILYESMRDAVISIEEGKGIVVSCCKK